MQLSNLLQLPHLRDDAFIRLIPCDSDIIWSFFTEQSRYFSLSPPRHIEFIDRFRNQQHLLWPTRIYVPRFARGNLFYTSQVWRGSTPQPYTCRERLSNKPAAVAIGPVLRSDPTIVNYRSTNNHVAGLIKRVAHDVQVDHNVLASFKQFLKQYVRTHYEPLPHFDFSHEFLDASWLDGTHQYTLPQKQRYHDLLDEWLNTDLSTDQFIKRHHSKLYTCKSFIKREFYSEPKFARIINSRPDLFKAIIAPFIKEIEHRVIYNEHFIKGKQPKDIAQRMREIQSKYQYIYETDYSSFEGSFTQEFQKACEYQLFKHMLSRNPQAFRILKPCFFQPNRVVLSTSHQWNYTATFPGSRMSGDMWTSLGNGFTNMMLFLYTVRCNCSRRGFHTVSYDFMVEGDDGFFGVSCPLNLQPIADLGFQLKLQTATDMNDLSFCGINLGPHNVPVIDFYRTLEKFGWSTDETVINNYSTKTTYLEARLVRARALSLLATAAGNPIAQPLALRLMTLTANVNCRARDFDWWERETFNIHHLTPETVPITDEMRNYFNEKFHITPQDQLRLEEYINKQNTIRFILPLTRPRC